VDVCVELSYGQWAPIGPGKAPTVTINGDLVAESRESANHATPLMSVVPISDFIVTYN
jgi:hypothetical protein